MNLFKSKIVPLAITLILSAFIFSCEKVIELPLNETAQRVVIEASTSNFIGDSFVKLSRTTTIYGKDEFQKINNATVTITDKDGNITTFIEAETNSGVYTHPTFVVGENNKYTLVVNVDNTTYTGESVTQSLTPLETIFTKKIPGGQLVPGVGVIKDTVYTLYIGYSDNVTEKNYYRFNVYANGVRNKRMNISDDKVSNGKTVTTSFFSKFDKNDFVFVEMINLDKANYTYFYSMANTKNGGPFSATPANPVSNIEGGAIGYFGAYLKDTLSILIH